MLAAGFALSFIGALLRVPRIATRATELLEMPVMLVVISALVAREKRRPTISTPAWPAS